MKRILRENGLTLVLLGLFAFTMVGQTLTGWRENNNEQREHRQAELSLGSYLASGHFWEATTENWESEFLQMGMFVVLTVFLFQKGSPESKSPDEEKEDPSRRNDDPDAPWPVRRGGVVLWLYSHSLSIAFGVMFLLCIGMHAWSGARQHADEQRAHGEAPGGIGEYVRSSQFWFESFQNWQSEFLSLAAMVYLSVYLRERDSAESKPVAMPHDEQE